MRIDPCGAAGKQEENRMIRTVIQIDREKCNGCGACAAACHEGAIGMVDGKAALLREDYCDGLGDCLPACPTGAIAFIRREAAAYDAAAVEANRRAAGTASGGAAAPAFPHAHPAGGAAAPAFPHAHPAGGCPGQRVLRLAGRTEAGRRRPGTETAAPSMLAQWPVQLRLVPVCAPFFDGCDLLIAADCAAYAYADFHRDYMAGHVTLIGCPKLDQADYAEKLTEILRNNTVRTVTVARMEVPCCGGLVHAVQQALERCGRQISLRLVTFSVGGEVRAVQEAAL